MAKKSKADPIPMTKEDCLQILSERDEKILAQMRVVFLEGDKKRDDILHQIGLTLQSNTELGERLMERTKILFDRNDDITKNIIPKIQKEYSDEIKTIKHGIDDIRAYQNERRGGGKMLCALCIGAAAFGSVGTWLTSLAIG